MSEQLYAEQRQLKERKVTGAAAAMQRQQKVSRLQKEIDYYELGDTISRAHIQAELVEIEVMQAKVNRLTAEVAERRRQLMANVFGEHIAID